MNEFPAGLVKELREQTGAGMMDCKRALEDAGGDLEAARKLLRERGVAEAGKRAGRETTEGIVVARVNERHGTLVAVGCETEPVAKNEEFLAFAQQVLDVVEREGPVALAKVEEQRAELVGKIGENIAVRGATRFDASDGEALAAYVHPPANKIGVLVKGKGSSETARLLAMHIAFAAPRYGTRSEVPAEELAAERDVYEKLPEVQSKPEQVRSKVVEGMLEKRFFGKSVLADQDWIHEPGKKVARALEEEGLELLAFERYALAG